MSKATLVIMAAGIGSRLRWNQAAGSDWTKWRDYHGLLHL